MIKHDISSLLIYTESDADVSSQWAACHMVIQGSALLFCGVLEAPLSSKRKGREREKRRNLNHPLAPRPRNDIDHFYSHSNHEN